MRFHADHPNERPNFVVIEIGGLALWFSYNTLIAFQEPGEPVVVSENCWGPTTGKHLGMVPGGNRKEERLYRDAFEERAGDLLDRIDIRKGPSIEQVREEFIQILHEDVQQAHNEPALR